MFFTAQEISDEDNKHVVIPLNTVEKYKNTWKTTYKSINEKYFNENKILTDEFLQNLKIKTK